MSEGKLTSLLRMGLLAALLLTVAPLKAEKVFTVTPSTFASSLKKAMKAFNGQQQITYNDDGCSHNSLISAMTRSFDSSS